MNIDISKIKTGDQVQVANGNWFEVVEKTDYEDDIMSCRILTIPGDNESEWWVNDNLITGHLPNPDPKPKWIDESIYSAAFRDNRWEWSEGIIDELNKHLTATYGKPVVVRVANGDEDDGDAIALSWDDLDKCWEVCVVSDLRIGEPYILQSDLPKPHNEVSLW